MLQLWLGSDLPHVGSHGFGQNSVLWSFLKQGRLRNVSQLCTQEEEVDSFRRPASCLLCAEAEFQAELHQMRDPELTLGGASAYDSD